jgi:cell division protein ZapE
MTPKARYQQELQDGSLQPDAEQAAVMDLLDELSSQITQQAPWQPNKASSWRSWFGGLASASVVHGPQGLYLWGGVGRGKTHLCDLFFDAVPIAEKRRLHFHRFMQRIHDDLTQLGEIENPLQRVADAWAVDARLLLLDEIHVNDITDAMLLGGLCSELFNRGVTLVTTSNVPPDGLYRDGLQRARFIPAIERIKAHTEVVEMVGDTDYRLRLLQTEATYLVKTLPASDDDMGQRMTEHFERLAFGNVDARQTVDINERDIPIRGLARDVVWFDFKALCASARSTHDYIEIATLFRTVLISDVPVMDDMKNDEARRFVNLVDEFYDRNVNLIVSADAPPDGLYTGKRLSFEFERSASRLTEMQTTEYLAKRVTVVPS